MFTLYHVPMYILYILYIHCILYAVYSIHLYISTTSLGEASASSHGPHWGDRMQLHERPSHSRKTARNSSSHLTYQKQSWTKRSETLDIRKVLIRVMAGYKLSCIIWEWTLEGTAPGGRYLLPIANHIKSIQIPCVDRSSFPFCRVIKLRVALLNPITAALKWNISVKLVGTWRVCNTIATPCNSTVWPDSVAMKIAAPTGQQGSKDVKSKSLQIFRVWARSASATNFVKCPRLSIQHDFSKEQLSNWCNASILLPFSPAHLHICSFGASGTTSLGQTYIISARNPLQACHDLETWWNMETWNQEIQRGAS